MARRAGIGEGHAAGRTPSFQPDPKRTLCPYKGVAHYLDVVVEGQHFAAAAWSYPEALPESARLTGYVSFDPEQLALALDGEPLLPADHQQVVAHGSDRNLAA